MAMMRRIDPIKGKAQLLSFLDSASAMLRHSGIDVGSYRKRLEDDDLREVLKGLCREITDKELTLPPGYWKSLYKAGSQITGNDAYVQGLLKYGE